MIGLAVELDLAEMGAVGTGIVTDVTDCPEVKPGEGQVITATFRHPPSTDVLDVWFEDCRARFPPAGRIAHSAGRNRPYSTTTLRRFVAKRRPAWSCGHDRLGA